MFVSSRFVYGEIMNPQLEGDMKIWANSSICAIWGNIPILFSVSRTEFRRLSTINQWYIYIRLTWKKSLALHMMHHSLSFTAKQQVCENNYERCEPSCEAIGLSFSCFVARCHLTMVKLEFVLIHWPHCSRVRSERSGFLRFHIFCPSYSEQNGRQSFQLSVSFSTRPVEAEAPPTWSRICPRFLPIKRQFSCCCCQVFTHVGTSGLCMLSWDSLLWIGVPETNLNGFHLLRRCGCLIKLKCCDWRYMVGHQLIMWLWSPWVIFQITDWFSRE